MSYYLAKPRIFIENGFNLQCKYFLFNLDTFKTPRFFNMISIAKNARGEGEFVFIISLFWRAIKIELNLPSFYEDHENFKEWDKRIFPPIITRNKT